MIKFDTIKKGDTIYDVNWRRVRGEKIWTAVEVNVVAVKADKILVYWGGAGPWWWEKHKAEAMCRKGFFPHAYYKENKDG